MRRLVEGEKSCQLAREIDEKEMERKKKRKKMGEIENEVGGC